MSRLSRTHLEGYSKELNVGQDALCLSLGAEAWVFICLIKRKNGRYSSADQKGGVVS
jgi:hypothetical protein